jgi:hypothetical protein
MKKKFLFGLLALIIAGGIVYSADHIDAPSLTNADGTGTANDIADIYAFQSPTDNMKMVLVMTWQGLMSPAKTAAFNIPNNQLFEFAIDNTGDNVEDLVIQAKVQDNTTFRVYGPVAPATTGLNSSIVTTGPMLEGTVTQYTSSSSPSIATGSTGIKSFIGPRDDPFFFDIVRFREIIAGTQTAFRNPGINTFAGTNVLAWVVEVPKSMLGSAATINVWGKIKTK